MSIITAAGLKTPLTEKDLLNVLRLPGGFLVITTSGRAWEGFDQIEVKHYKGCPIEAIRIGHLGERKITIWGLWIAKLSRELDRWVLDSEGKQQVLFFGVNAIRDIHFVGGAISFAIANTPFTCTVHNMGTWPVSRSEVIGQDEAAKLRALAVKKRPSSSHSYFFDSGLFDD